MSRSVRTWLNQFRNPDPSPQHERLADQRGVVYWLQSIADAEGRPAYLRLFYRGKRLACEGCLNVVILTWDLPDRLYLNEICLPPKQQGAGLGSQLLRRIITLAKQQGVRSIRGDIAQRDMESTPGLLDWYRRYGFRVEPPTKTSYAHCIVLDLI